MTTMRMTCLPRMLVVTCVVLSLLAHTCTAQNYHYSNGWYAGGKKRSPGPSVASAAATSAGVTGTGGRAGVAADSLDTDCSMRPEALALIERIVQTAGIPVLIRDASSRGSGGGCEDREAIGGEGRDLASNPTHRKSTKKKIRGSSEDAESVCGEHIVRSTGISRGESNSTHDTYSSNQQHTRTQHGNWLETQSGENFSGVTLIYRHTDR
ncbi:preprogonadotropin-releasing hormone-like protein [Elysia marginata]|uniref:Preprogonadotropin-releasing hormone-like protein n=1 Tax=Elysia marginata TaxID=1093978 RepID=A0AAV4E920_9GAST|nr:preprogonadotropin-releasing hormone-like protein [Elysia marginata]